MMKKCCLCLAGLAVTASLVAEEVSFDGCFAHWDAQSLTVGNAGFSRTYRPSVLPSVTSCEVLSGSGTASVACDRLNVSAVDKLGYVWVKLLK